MTSGDDRLILDRPENRRLAYLPTSQELLGEWQPTELTRFLPGRGYAGIGLGDVSGQIAFDGIAVTHSRCPDFTLRYRYTANGRIEKIGGAELPTESKGCEALHDQPAGPDMPQPWDMMRVLHANPMVEKVDNNTLLVSTDEIALLLERAQ